MPTLPTMKRVCVWLVIGLTLASQPAFAAVDRTFGRDGSIGLDMEMSGAGMLLRPDGRILLAGQTLPGRFDNTRFDIRQFLPTGRPDGAFSGDGRIVVPIGTRRARQSPRDVMLRPDGSALLVGSAFVNERRSFAAVRLTPDGRLDDSFDGDGRALYGVPRLGWRGTAVDALPAGRGRALIAGSTEGRFALLRIRRSGVVDRSFGEDGWAIHSVSANDTGIATAAALQPDGRIVVVGGGDWFLIARYRRNGARDRTFGVDGEVELDFQAWSKLPYSIAEGVAVDDRGRIVVVGSVYDGSGPLDVDMVVVRLRPDGALDRSFGDRGAKLIRWRAGADELARSVAIDGQGRIVVAGSVESGATRSADYAVCRLFPDGRLDRRFGNEGWLRADLSWRYPPNSNDQVYRVRLDPLGRIVVFGTAGGTSRAGVVRFRP